MNEDRHVKFGDIIKIHFSGMLEDGSVFDSSFNNDPLRFKVGNGEVIIGIDEAVIGMQVGHEKKIHITSDKAYGPIEKELIITLDRDKLPQNLSIKENQELQVPTDDDEPFTVRISKLTDKTVELDGNHPLAGKNLIFHLKLVEIE